jgi:hypothetical protein
VTRATFLKLERMGDERKGTAVQYNRPAARV